MPASTSRAATEARETEMVISSGDAFPSRDTEVLNSDNASTAIPGRSENGEETDEQRVMWHQIASGRDGVLSRQHNRPLKGIHDKACRQRDDRKHEHEPPKAGSPAISTAQPLNPR